jgi:DNA-3-methyladenine glycosylase II
LTAARLASFPEVVDCYEDSHYQRLVFIGHTPHLLAVTQRGAPSRATLDVTVSGKHAKTKAARRAVETVLDNVFRIRSDVRSFYRNFSCDPLLGPLITKFRGLRVVGRETLWETLVQIIISQQINLRFAHSILCELATELGLKARFNGRLYFNFPSPQCMAKMTVDELRSFRLSRSKSETILRLARTFGTGAWTEDELRSMADEELIELLTSFKGVGRWTAEFTLLRGMSRLDVFPAGDLGVVKYFAKEMLGYETSASEQGMREYADRWRPYRGLALIYVYAELARRMQKAGQ